MRVALSACFMLAAVAACDDDGKINTLPDAPLPPDAGPDAPLGPVTLTVTDGGSPRRGVVVLFQNADSTLVERTTTDAQGVARAVLGAGGFVTAVNPFASESLPQLGGPPPAALRTFAGVKPGDELRLERAREDNATDLTLVVPVDPQASYYTLWTTCGSLDITNGSGSGGSGSGSGTPGGSVQLYGCGATIDVAVETFDGEYQPMNAFVRRNVAVTSGMTLDLSNETYAAAAQVALGYTALPAGITTLNVAHSLVTENGSLHTRFLGIDVTAGAASATIERPPASGATVVTSTELFNGSFGRHTVLDWGPAAAAYTLSGANVLLEEYSAVPSYSVTNHAVTWTANAGVRPDFAIAETAFSRIENQTEIAWDWHVVAPYGAATVVYPVLPGDEDRYNAKVEDTIRIEELTTLKVPGGYDTARELAFSPERLVVGASGRVVLQELQFTEVRRAPRESRTGHRAPAGPRAARR